MIKNSTLLGYIVSVTGPSINIKLVESVASGLSIINGTTYRIGQVGSFVKIPLGYLDLYGVVTGVGATAVPEKIVDIVKDTGRWMLVELVGEGIVGSFERGISQHPNINDEVHIVTTDDLENVYGEYGIGHIPIGFLSSAESLLVRIELDKLVTRHSAILGSTGSGKSTAVTSLLRSIVENNHDTIDYPNSRILLLDIHGEYASALGDIASIFRINPNSGEKKLAIPYWCLDAADLFSFLTGGLSDEKALHIYDKVTELKRNSLNKREYPGATIESLTLDTPIPYSLKRLWYELIDVELTTFEGPNRDQRALEKEGDIKLLVPPKYKPYAMGAAGPFMNTQAPGIRRQLNTLRSRLLDKQYDFLLHPEEWEPDEQGVTKKDLSDILEEWLGHQHNITILDLSGVPSPVLIRLIGAILKIVYEALFWSRDKSEGGVERPLLVVMEEAHRYLHSEANNSASEIVQRIVKEGRKYGIGAMIVSQRPSEVDETILSQCGTFFTLRLSNPADRSKVTGTLPDNLTGLMDTLPVLRTGEAIISGESAKLPARCRILLPERKPNSEDPKVSEQWLKKRITESYDRMSASWRAQYPRWKDPNINIKEIIKVEEDK